MRTNLIRGIGIEMNCTPAPLGCVRGPDVVIENRTHDYISVIVKGKPFPVRDFCRLEIYDVEPHDI